MKENTRQPSPQSVGSRKRRKLRRGCLIALLGLFGGCGIGWVALSPGEGPPMLLALPPDADVVARARGIDELWAALESNPRFGCFLDGPAGKALLESGPGREIASAFERATAAGLTRARASHLIGREAGVAVWLAPTGRRVRDWIAAFRIDTTARIAELAAGRLFLTGNISRSTEAGATVASFMPGGGASVHWSRLGDLLVVAGSRAALARAVGNCLAESPEGGADPEERFAGVAAEAAGFDAAVRLARPADLLAAAGVAKAELDGILRASGMPAPLRAASVSFRIEAGRILEEVFLEGHMPPAQRGAVGGGDGPGAGVRPKRADAHLVFRPGRREAAERLRRLIGGALPAGARAKGFADLVLSRVGGEVAFAVAEQDSRAREGGFPAEFAFFRVPGAEAVRAAIENVLAAHSLGVFENGAPLPTRYPYLVKRRVSAARGGAGVYEIVIRNTRRHEGYRPAIAIRGDEIIHSSSLAALEEFLAGQVDPPAVAMDKWLALPGERVLAFDWRTPSDLRPIRNAFDFFDELFRARTRSAARLLAERTDGAETWTAIESVLGELRSQRRIGVLVPGGVRMRAVWEFAE